MIWPTLPISSGARRECVNSRSTWRSDVDHMQPNSRRLRVEPSARRFAVCRRRNPLRCQPGIPPEPRARHNRAAIRTEVAAMETKYDISSAEVQLAYGFALIVFGEAAVGKVLGHAKWLEKYPSALSRVHSEESTKFGVTLPGEVIYEIAGQEECLYDFYADPDGVRLYAVARDRKWAEPPAAETMGDRKISAQEALLSYGAHSLFAAVDKGTGLKGEKYE